jgi:hypothetical protein
MWCPQFRAYRPLLGGCSALRRITPALSASVDLRVWSNDAVLGSCPRQPRGAASARCPALRDAVVWLNTFHASTFIARLRSQPPNPAMPDFSLRAVARISTSSEKILRDFKLMCWNGLEELRLDASSACAVLSFPGTPMIKAREVWLSYWTLTSSCTDSLP